MIRVKDLTKKYRCTYALKGVNFHVKRGELFAYLGPNGAGKSTTIRILTGLTRLTSGEAWVGGYHIDKEALLAKKTFGLVMQSINLDQELTVRENLDIHGRLFGMGSSQRKKAADRLLDYVELSSNEHHLVKRLSGGMKRRLMIARALMHSPGILFLDEPTVGLDPAIRRRIWALIKKIQGEGTTILLTTHYIEEAEFLADRVAFLDQGEIVATDTPQHLMASTGQWAIDRPGDHELKTVFFKSRTEAEYYARKSGSGYTLRRVNLEDAFLRLTGKKVRSE